MRFLCESHRHEILNTPQIAIEHWEQWMQQARQFMQHQQWQQARSYLGCSYEIAEWLIQQSTATSASQSLSSHHIIDYAERLMLSGHSLAECFRQSRLHDLELQFLLNTHNYLLSTSKPGIQQHWRLRKYLKISLSTIEHFMQNRGEFNTNHRYYH